MRLLIDCVRTRDKGADVLLSSHPRWSFEASGVGFVFQIAFVWLYCRTPLIRTLVIRIVSYPEWHGPSGKFVENSTKLTSLEITGYRIKYSTVLWLLELQIRRDRKV